MVDNDRFYDKCHQIARSFQYYENHTEMCVSMKIKVKENSLSFEYFDPRKYNIQTTQSACNHNLFLSPTRVNEERESIIKQDNLFNNKHGRICILEHRSIGYTNDC